MFTMDLPSCMDLTSGSRPRLPTRMTLFTLPAIGASFAFPVPAGRRHLPHRRASYSRSPVGSHRFWVVSLDMPRIALIHATPAAVDPIRAAFAEAWPEPDLVNLLDDSLSHDRALVPDLTDGIYSRFDALGAYSVAIGADGILFTCSAFGPAIE